MRTTIARAVGADQSLQPALCRAMARKNELVSRLTASRHFFGHLPQNFGPALEVGGGRSVEAKRHLARHLVNNVVPFVQIDAVGGGGDHRQKCDQVCCMVLDFLSLKI